MPRKMVYSGERVDLVEMVVQQGVSGGRPLQGRRELQRAFPHRARCKAGRCPRSGRHPGHQGGRQAGKLASDAHLTGHDPAPGSIPIRGEAALHKEVIQADF